MRTASGRCAQLLMNVLNSEGTLSRCSAFCSASGVAIFVSILFLVTCDFLFKSSNAHCTFWRLLSPFLQGSGGCCNFRQTRGGICNVGRIQDCPFYHCLALGAGRLSFLTATFSYWNGKFYRTILWPPSVFLPAAVSFVCVDPLICGSRKRLDATLRGVIFGDADYPLLLGKIAGRPSEQRPVPFNNRRSKRRLTTFSFTMPAVT